jgi:RNA polymerase sigma-70 factor (ECF subfamily)
MKHQLVGGEIQAPPAELALRLRSHEDGSYRAIRSEHSGPGRQRPKEVTVRAARQAEQRELADGDVVRLAQQGDAVAFEQIYRTHSRRLYALCLRMIGNPADAEEFTQDAFLQLFRKIHTFRGDAVFSTWLHRLTVNIVLMKLRKKTLPSDSLDENAEPDEETGKRCPELGGPDLRLNGSIDRVHLQRAVDQLPPGYKQMFILHDVQGYGHEEIAGILGCSVGNSKSQLHKARMRLRELLQKALGNSSHQHRNASAGSLAMDRLKYTYDYANA